MSNSFANTVIPPFTKKIVKSTIIWEGKKVAGKHSGTINLKSGELTFNEDGDLSGGTFKLDMNSILCTDLSVSSANKLIGHLKSEGFFGVEKYPISTLQITEASAKGNGVYQVTADVTIKGITKQVIFETTVTDDTATANITLNRSAFNVKYGSGSFFKSLGNKMIKDKFTLQVELKF